MSKPYAGTAPSLDDLAILAEAAFAALVDRSRDAADETSARP